MTQKQAESIFLTKKQGFKIFEIADYDQDHYVVIASKQENLKDAIDPYYAIDKKTGEVTDFFPEDLEKFFEVFKLNGDD